MRDERPEHFWIMFRGMWAGLLAISLTPNPIIRMLINEALCFVVFVLCAPLRQTVRQNVVIQHLEDFARSCGMRLPPPVRMAKQSKQDRTLPPGMVLLILAGQSVSCLVITDNPLLRFVYTMGLVAFLDDELTDYCTKIAVDRRKEFKGETPIIWNFSREE